MFIVLSGVDEELTSLGKPDISACIMARLIRLLVELLLGGRPRVVWDGCNECVVEVGTPTEIYVTFVMAVVGHAPLPPIPSPPMYMNIQ